MSYILDALKKAEAERRRGKGPDIMTEPVVGRRAPERRPWVYAVLIVLAAAAGSAGWYLGHEKTAIQTPSASPVAQNYSAPVQHSSQPPQTQASGASEQAQPTPPAQIPAVRAKTPSDTAPAMNQKKTASPDKKETDLPRDSKKIKSGEPKMADASKLAPAKSAADHSAGEGGPRPEKKIIPDNRIYTFNELPESVRHDLPSLVISTHIYSPEKAERLAAINGHIGREGQEILPGVVLESIITAGAILRSQGYRFKIGLK